jgi:hypothetical protein
MPTVPIIIPIIVVGILVGSIMKTGKKSMSKKKLLLAGLVTGGLNAAYSYVLEMITPRTTLPTGTGFTANRAFSVSVGLGFYIASFLVGLVLILAVFVIAAVYLRVRGGGEPETPEEPDLEEESQLSSG